jgi:hypothetical protein
MHPVKVLSTNFTNRVAVQDIQTFRGRSSCFNPHLVPGREQRRISNRGHGLRSDEKPSGTAPSRCFTPLLIRGSRLQSFSQHFDFGPVKLDGNDTSFTDWWPSNWGRMADII